MFRVMGGGEVKKRGQQPVVPGVAKVLLVTAAFLFIFPPIIAGAAVGGETSAGAIASVIVCWQIALVLFFVGGVIGVTAVLTADHDRVEELELWREELQLWRREDLGLDVDGKWVCFDHDVVECPVCVAKVNYPAPEPPESGVACPASELGRPAGRR